MSFCVSETWPRRRSDLMITDWRDISDWMRVKESVVETLTGLLLQTDFHPSVSVRLVISLKHSYDNITWSKRKSLFPSCSPLGFYFTGTISCLLLWCRRRGRAAHQPDSDRKIKIHNINWCRVFKNKISPIFHDLFHNLSMVVRERRHLLIEET